MTLSEPDTPGHSPSETGRKGLLGCSLPTSQAFRAVARPLPVSEGRNSPSAAEKKPFQNNGWGGIRTHERLSPLPVFKTGAFNRSATHPNGSREPTAPNEFRPSLPTHLPKTQSSKPPTAVSRRTRIPRLENHLPRCPRDRL